MYSALKRRGKPLYELARKGLEVERAARRVLIYEIALRAWQPPDPREGGGGLATIDVRCSSGTYIRSLAHDVGAALGCGGHLTALTRLASGSFTLEDAVTLENLRGLSDLEGLLRPLDAALQDLPAVTLDADAARRILLGQAIPLNGVEALAGSPLYRAYDAGGILLALIAYDSTNQLWRPKKVLAGSND
jgi:tRNA pseudouridine55 synthase